MTFEAARPRYTLQLAGKEYELIGTLEVVEAVEYAFKEGISQVTARTPEMGLTDTAKLLAAILTSCGHNTSAREAARTLFDLGVNSQDFQLTQLHAYSFLRVLLEPPEAREATAKRMGEALGGWASPASPGKPTRKSA